MANKPLDSLPLTNLFDANKPIIVAMSGGVDSSVLYHILKSHGYTLVIAHVHHGKRLESNKELKAIKAFANQEDVPFESVKLSIDDTGNFHDTARQARLQFFKACAIKHHTNQVALGHHKDDQAETVLMRAISGAPITAWQSMTPCKMIDDIQYIRPLLSVNKQTLIDYAESHQISYFEDVSNRDEQFTRNRFRHKIMPLLKKENPNIIDGLNRTAQASKHVDCLLDEHVATFLSHHDDPIPIEAFKNLNPLVKQRLLTTLLRRYDDKATLTQWHIDEIIRQLETARGNFAHHLLENVTLHYEYGTFTLKKTSSKNNQPYIKVDTPQTVTIDGINKYLITEEEIVHKYSNCHTIWYNETVFPLVFRTRRQGDKMLCSVGHKKLKDLFIEHKVPPSKRNTLIVLANDEEVLWVPFLKMGKAKQIDNTRKLYVCEVPVCSTKTSKKR